MADCEFVSLDGIWLPNVASVVNTPEYTTDAEKSISGILRVLHISVARGWRITLTGVPGDQVATLQSLLVTIPAPRNAIIMGDAVQVMVTLDQVTHVPKLSGAKDVGRVNMVITMREMGTWVAPPGPLPGGATATADTTLVTADSTLYTADAA